MGEGFLDIVLFALVAAFLVLRLRRVLGRRGGREGSAGDPLVRHGSSEQAGDNVIQLPDQAGADAGDGSAAALPSPASAPAEGISEIKRADKRFDIQAFLTGAHMSFEMVLGAFAAGERKQLESLLSPEVFANFSQAIKEREESGESIDDSLVGIRSADMVEAYMEGRTAHVTVKFVSDQVSVVRNGSGDVIEGDPAHTTEVTDFWTFARDVRSRDLNWTLVATRSLD